MKYRGHCQVIYCQFIHIYILYFMSFRKYGVFRKFLDYIGKEINVVVNG
jgi:hypothetical protein